MKNNRMYGRVAADPDFSLPLHPATDSEDVCVYGREEAGYCCRSEETRTTLVWPVLPCVLLLWGTLDVGASSRK